MGQIFISYSSDDAAFAHRLAEAFEGEGWSVWWDKQIPPGMDYARVIEAAVNAASCIVVLWSRHSIGSRWVHTEAAAGADRNIVITTLIDDTPNEAIPFEFKRLQAVRLSDWRPGRPHDGYAMVAARIRAILDEPAPAVTPRPAPDSWRNALTQWGRGAQRLWRGAAVAALLAAVALAMQGLAPGQSMLFAVAALAAALGVFLLHQGRRPA
jgi:hypothetical protein